MKFKEKMNQAAGFTLVELIVVIAILAILAGVAVPAYSGYITQANKQADISLVSDIKQALTLAYYSGDLTESGSIILSTDGIVNATEIAAGSPVDVAMKNAFGENWKTSLALKYGEWAISEAFKTLTANAAKLVANSSYVTGSTPDTLMNSVSSLTHSMSVALGTKVDKPVTIKNNLDPDSFNAVLNQLGMTEAEYATLSDAQLSNFALLAVAHEMSLMTEETSEFSALGGLVNEYAQFSGYAYSEFASEEEKLAYEAMNAELSNPSAEALEEADGSYTKFAKNQIDAYKASLNSQKLAEYNNNSIATDMQAIVAMMSALNEGSSGLTTEDLNSTALATEGVVGEYFDQYVNAALVLSAIDSEIAGPGQVSIHFAVDNAFTIFATID